MAMGLFKIKNSRRKSFTLDSASNSNPNPNSNDNTINEVASHSSSERSKGSSSQDSNKKGKLVYMNGKYYRMVPKAKNIQRPAKKIESEETLVETKQFDKYPNKELYPVSRKLTKQLLKNGSIKWKCCKCGNNDNIFELDEYIEKDDLVRPFFQWCDSFCPNCFHNFCSICIENKLVE
ncbi:uncharacterized protein ASCRUDRAFT_6123 [Ascoidea rubescens DSM 1968]|uniref:Uncharacterized protein n=1 Tax=Ascoidea rubescens DSM 1968 TaxID=1344418 RepID=A0A1D2VRT1_9ASCO|nr:hypothetical protein ASCRUDRAFT_6123 [Ascoidea rubescens DSM 1968]ODV64277.1 hypothetical protein ASCRUDRAFT_6123 [Ascoidea rubescens DSM 1968]